MTERTPCGGNDGLPRDRGLLGYGILVVLAGLAVSSQQFLFGPPLDAVSLLVWTSAFFVADAMWFRTPAGRGTVSMASTIHLAALPALGAPGLVVAAWVSRMAVNLVLQRKTWPRAVFNGAQLSLALVAASLVFQGLAHGGAVPEDARTLFGLLPAFGAAAAAYYLLNTGLVCVALSRMNREGLLATWRENYGYRSGVISTLALIALAPLAALAQQGFGYVGLALFFLPIWFIRGNWHRHIALQHTQRAVLDSADTAAKGELVASVGNELQTYVSFLAANLKNLEEDRSPRGALKRKERLAQLAAQVERMAQLSQGLMNSSHLECCPEDTDVIALTRDTVGLLRDQGIFKGIVLLEDYDPEPGLTLVDRGQMERALLALLMNAAEALQETSPAEREISVSMRWSRSGDELELCISDSGPGVPKEDREQIFQPGFSTKPSANGIGLASVKRVVETHRGAIAVEDSEYGGARFHIRLPGRSRGREAAA